VAIAAVVPSDAVVPGAARFEAVLDVLEANGTQCVILAPTESGTLLNALQPLVPTIADPLGPEGVTTYDGLLLHLSDSIASCLSK